jgi:hypothetical protein
VSLLLHTPVALHPGKEPLVPPVDQMFDRPQKWYALSKIKKLHNRMILNL